MKINFKIIFGTIAIPLAFFIPILGFFFGFGALFVKNENKLLGIILGIISICISIVVMTIKTVMV